MTQDGSKDNKHYRYYWGWNIQGVIAYLVGIALPFPGFVGTLGANVSISAQNLGHLGWMISFVASFIVYYLICLVWPTKNQKIIREMGLKWEEISYNELIAADGTVISAEQEGYPDPILHSDDEKKWKGAVYEGSDSPTRS